MNGDRSAIRAWLREQTRVGRRQALPVILMSLCGSLAAIGQAWCVALILGAALAGASLASGLGASLANSSMVAALLGFAAAALLRAGLQVGGEILSARAGGVARRRLRRETAARILADGPRLLRRTHSGALAGLVVDRIEAVDGFFARYLAAAVVAAAGPMLVLLAAALVQPFAAVVLLCCGIAVPVLQALFGIGAAAATRRQFEALSRLQTRFVDRIRGIATIVLAGRAEDEARRLAVAADELRVRTMRVLRVAFLSSAGLDCALAAALLAIVLHDGRVLLLAGPGLAGSGLMGAHSPVTRSLFALLLVPEFFAPLRGFALAYQDRMQAGACAQALTGLPAPTPASPPALAPSPSRQQGIDVTFEDVHFTWDSARGTTLDGLSFHASPNETMLLVGPSGSGKSTLIEMLLGFIRPDRGRVMIDGTDLQSLTPAEISERVAWIGQNPVLFAGSLRDNILFARPDATAEALEQALRVAALDQVVAELPDGLDTRIGEGGYGLSGGQAQRVAIARAMLRRAPLLLLDEPTAHLDPETERAILDSLRQLARHRTVVMASHSAAAQGLGGRRLDLVGGRLAAEQGAA